MSHAAAHPIRQLATPRVTRPDPGSEALAMRLLRHHTKNALQRIIAQVSASELRATAAGTVLADDIERRIRLSARVSDALFGLTEAPGPIDARLAKLCDGVVALMSDPVQTIATSVQTVGVCPERLAPTVLQVAHEMVTNAVRHGLHMRLKGEITVRLEVRAPGAGPNRPMGGLTLTVGDDGWGPDKPGFGEGLTVLALMVEPHGGRIDLARESGWTASRLCIPGPL